MSRRAVRVALGGIVVTGVVVAVVGGITRDRPDPPASRTSSTAPREQRDGASAATSRRADRAAAPASGSSARPATEPPPRLGGAADERLRGVPRPHGDDIRAAIGLSPRDGSAAQDPRVARARAQLAANDAANARSTALEVLAGEPEHEAMLQLAAQASCMLADVAEAQRLYDLASPGSRLAITTTCHARGIELARSTRPAPPIDKPPPGPGARQRVPMSRE